jgi:hypothetical protein
MIAYPMTRAEQRLVVWGGRLLTFAAVGTVAALGLLAFAAA